MLTSVTPISKQLTPNQNHHRHHNHTQKQSGMVETTQSPLAMLVLVTPYTLLYFVNERKFSHEERSEKKALPLCTVPLVFVFAHGLDNLT